MLVSKRGDSQDERAGPLLPDMAHREVPALAYIGSQPVALLLQQRLHQLLHLQESASLPDCNASIQSMHLHGQQLLDYCVLKTSPPLILIKYTTTSKSQFRLVLI